MNIEELIIRQTYKRIERVRSADWLSFTDLCFHCGFRETKMREITKYSDFPRPSNPTGSAKGERWPRVKVDAWMEAREMEGEKE